MLTQSRRSQSGRQEGPDPIHQRNRGSRHAFALGGEDADVLPRLGVVEVEQ
jgi:hypothetical protein